MKNKTKYIFGYVVTIIGLILFYVSLYQIYILGITISLIVIISGMILMIINMKGSNKKEEK